MKNWGTAEMGTVTFTMPRLNEGAGRVKVTVPSEAE
jgi:hypothetical protein